MFIFDKRFLKPTKDTRIVSILENLHFDPEISQNELGKRSGLSSAMINNYLKELEEKGLIEPVPVDGKKFRYNLTEKGERVRRSMLGEYMAEIVQIYSALKNSIKDKLQKIISSGIREIIFWGASTTCEVVLSAVDPAELKVITLIDSDPKKHGTLLFGYVISPPEVLRYLKCRSILITSFARHEEIKDQILNKMKLKDVRIFTL